MKDNQSFNVGDKVIPDGMRFKGVPGIITAIIKYGGPIGKNTTAYQVRLQNGHSITYPPEQLALYEPSKDVQLQCSIRAKEKNKSKRTTRPSHGSKVRLVELNEMVIF